MSRAVCAIPEPLDYKKAKATYSQVRKDTNYKLSPEANRREAARRLGTDYETYNKALSSKSVVRPTSVASGKPAKLPINYPSDTKVPDSISDVLDQWVQLQGSGKISKEERAQLAAVIQKYGEDVKDRLYRGVNEDGLTMSKATEKYAVGKKFNWDAASASTARDAALPYAENGDGPPILISISQHGSKAKAINVSERAEDVAGFSEEEWIVGGPLTVITSGVHDGILHVVMR